MDCLNRLVFRKYQKTILSDLYRELFLMLRHLSQMMLAIQYFMI